MKLELNDLEAGLRTLGITVVVEQRQLALRLKARGLSLREMGPRRLAIHGSHG